MYGPVRVCRIFRLENKAARIAASGAITMMCHPLKARTMMKASERKIPMVLMIFKSIKSSLFYPKHVK
jgi:hypothetical protein